MESQLSQARFFTDFTPFSITKFNLDYDDLDRVTRADYLVNHLTNVYEAFAMDDLGNRDGSQTLRDGSSDSYSVDTTTNRYTSIDSANLDYDDAGNLTDDKDGYRFTYDYENRISKIHDDQDSLVAEFDYDTQNRRIRVYDADRWRMDYNHYRPHSSLDYMAPAAFAAMCLEQGSATLRLPQDRENMCDMESIRLCSKQAVGVVGCWGIVFHGFRSATFTRGYCYLSLIGFWISDFDGRSGQGGYIQ
ncbi:MAG: transposase [Phycisphaerae bacterium]|nr:transposase [Phycisphaerae bacterium]